MAVYEYECQACQRRFEIQQPMHDYERLKRGSAGLPGLWPEADAAGRLAL